MTQLLLDFSETLTDADGDTVNEWDFRDFIAGKKMRWEKRKAAEEPPKPIKITCTEIQLKRARQLYYARSAGFNIGYADYKRFYLVP